jgi:hypothetical protein
MNGIFQMQGSKNWILPKYINANRDSHWLDIWSNHFCPSMGPNGGSVATEYGLRSVIGTTEYTEWQRPLSGVHVHSIMMEKLAQAGEGGGCTPFPFHYIYHHVQLSCAVRSS